MDTKRYQELMISILKMKINDYNHEEKDDIDIIGKEYCEGYDEGYNQGMLEAIRTLKASSFLVGDK